MAEWNATTPSRPGTKLEPLVVIEDLHVEGAGGEGGAEKMAERRRLSKWTGRLRILVGICVTAHHEFLLTRNVRPVFTMPGLRARCQSQEGVVGHSVGRHRPLNSGFVPVVIVGRANGPGNPAPSRPRRSVRGRTGRGDRRDESRQWHGARRGPGSHAGELFDGG